MSETHDRIAVVDFGGQYAHLIATKVRETNVLAEIRQPDAPLEAFIGFKGIILSGSPSLASQGEDSDWTKDILDLDVPILGFCFGHQEIAKHYGGTVIHGGREWGHADLMIQHQHPIFAGLSAKEVVWMSHFDSVASLGPDFYELGYSVSGEGDAHRNAAIASDVHRRYGFQYHPEVDATANGDRMISNFILDICKCAPSWDMARYVESEVQAIRNQVGDQSVFLLASGGVDSTVAAKLLRLALPGDRLKLLHVDNGMMRKNESVGVAQLFAELGLSDCLYVVDASDSFLEALDGVIEPESKRRAIGDTFIEIFEREASRLGIADHLLGQGTIYPDTIETGGTKRAHVIKTHHNRVPVIEQMIASGRVVEPLADLYKVEVRNLAEQLGVPRAMAWRHPFPGPGLGVRLLCADGTVTAPDVQSDIDKQLSSFAGISGLALPVKSVGVKADLRSYEHPVMLSGQADWDVLTAAANHILKHVPSVNRCIWSLGQAPTQVTARPGYMTRERLDLLREADHLVMAGLIRHGIYDDIWQCPTAMLPLAIDNTGHELVVLRPVHSARAMTAWPAQLPRDLMEELHHSIMALDGVGGVGIDLTSKPPGTIEWE